MYRTAILIGLSLTATLAGCGGKVVVDAMGGGGGGSGSGGSTPTSCGCQNPDDSDPALPFCDRVCDGAFTNWIGPCGTVEYQIDCSSELPGGVCLVYEDTGGAYCGPPGA